jgi:hypothetical protein
LLRSGAACAAALLPTAAAVAAPPSLTTIEDIAVETDAVRARLVVTLTHAVSHRVTQPDPRHLVVDFARADFDFAKPVDLKQSGSWVVDWGYGYLLFGYTRVSLAFDRDVTVVGDAMAAETARAPAALTVDVVEA